MRSIQTHRIVGAIMLRVSALCVLMASGCVLMASGGVGDEIKVTTGRLGDLETVSMENSQVRVRIVLSRGASIDEYVLKATGHNQFFSNASQLRDATESEPEFMEGGYVEILGPADGWPGPPIWRRPFDWVTEKEKGRLYIECSAVEPAAEIKITRKVELFAASTELRITVNAQNVSSGSTYCWVCAHSRMSVGGNPDEKDVLIYPDSGTEQYRKMNFVRRQHVRHDFGTWGKWFGVVDPEALETLVKINSPDDLMQAGAWFGDDYIPQYRWGRKLKPNESLVFQERYFIVQDLPTIEAVSDNVILSMGINKDVFGSTDPAEITIIVGSPQERTAGRGVLAITSGGKVVETIEFHIGKIRPGCVAKSMIAWNTKGHPDGRYRACLEIPGEIHHEIPFEINRGQVDPVRKKMVSVKDWTLRCRQTSGETGETHASCLKGYLYSVEWLIPYLDEAYHDGRYPAAEELIDQIEGILERAERETGKKGAGGAVN